MTEAILEKLEALAAGNEDWLLKATTAVGKQPPLVHLLILSKAHDLALAHVNRLIEADTPLDTAPKSVGAHAGSVASMTRDELVDAVVEATRKCQRAESVAISDVGTQQWDLIRQAAGLRLVARVMPAVEVAGSPVLVPSFRWGPEYEPSQHDRYFPHLKNLFPLPRGRNSQLTWLDAGSSHQDLLNYSTAADQLYYHKISGNTDVAVLTLGSYLIKMPQTGLCILFELKKAIEKKHVCQGLCQLLLANLHSPDLFPVVVLTDLQDEWQLHWMSGREVYSGAFRNAVDAVVTIRLLLEQAQVVASGAPSSTTPPAVEGMPDLLNSRKVFDFKLDAEAMGAPDINMEELAEFVSTEERLEQRMLALLRHPRLSFLMPHYCELRQQQLPAVMDTIGCTKPPFGMFS